MEKKSLSIIPLGMNQDTSVVQMDQQSAFEIRNMRITTTGKNTNLCLKNEKSNKKVENIDLDGVVLGCQELSDYVILFIKHEDNTDSIVKVFEDPNENLTISYLFKKGNLKFDRSNPIESIGIYENEKIQKVYWVDGINSPRVINVCKTYTNDNSSQFDFIPILNNDKPLNLKVSPVFNTNANFHGGVLQYAVSYFNKYGQQSPIIYQSPLYYTSDNGRGLNPDGTQKTSVSFKLNIYNTSTDWEYIRVYRIMRTTLDGTPSVEILGDFKPNVNDEDIITYDTGTTGTSVDPSELLFLGGTDLIASTIEHKDGTLFLGNIKDDKLTISEDIKKEIKDMSSLEFVLSEDNPNTLIEDTTDTLNTQWIFNSNLLKSSKESTHFQCGEVYRFGVQFLSNKGTWSEVVYLGDLENDKRIIPYTYNDGIKNKPILKAEIAIPQAIKQKYIGAKLVCVYPTIQDRNVLCQGIVCPTVFNIADRDENGPYAQSSWFARPQSFGGIFSMLLNDSVESEFKTDIIKKGVPIKSTFSPNHEYFYDYGFTRTVGGIYNSLSANGEIQCLSNILQCTEEASYNAFGVDTRIVTLHSPELDDIYYEDLYTIPLTSIKFRLIGYIPIKTTFSDLSIQVDNPMIPGFSGVYFKDIFNNSKFENNSTYTYGNSLVSKVCWVDGIAFDEDGNDNINDDSKVATYPIYPWHRSGSLSNQGRITNTSNKKSVLKTKTLSNLRIGLPSRYFSNIYDLNTSNIELWSSKNTTNDIKVLKTSELWGINTDIIYKGNIDTLITFTGKKFQDRKIETPITYLQAGTCSNWKTSLNKESLFTVSAAGDKMSYATFPFVVSNTYSTPEIHNWNTEPIPMQYKSTGHAVFALGLHNNTTFRGIPKLYNIDNVFIKEGEFSPPSEFTSFNIEPNSYGESFNSRAARRFLLKEEEFFDGIYHKNIPCPNDPINEGNNRDGFIDNNNANIYYFLIGELYRDNVLNRFGGNSEQALANNIWTTCGDIVYFNNTTRSNESVIDYIELIGDQGDTYYCRYDHLKTQPLGEGNVNNIVDIVSFMCETRINIDGRYDRNRGLESNLHITSNNFNLFNKVYSQKNNFFTGSYLRTDDLFSTKFPSQIMWTKTKTLGEEIDSWTNIIPTSVLDLDGDKGELVSLTKYGNEIWAFQEEGISKILYNNRVQINASDGIPIEISNSGKVEGKVYLPYIYGCQNKWSIIEATGGLYFIDNYNSSILHMSPEGSLTDISTTKGMSSWINNFKNLTKYSWLPGNFNSIRSLYDPNTKDIYFTTDKEALAFNELIGKFTSFYSYDKVSNLFNIKGKTYQIREGKIWELQGGDDYSKFFKNTKKYSLSIIANSEFSTDKIFDTVEFRTNDTSIIEYGKASYYPFNNLKVENDYQSSETNTATLKKKFRTWRWQVGRAGKAGRDRIRNPWAKFTLEGDSIDELKVYDMNVIYYT